MEEIWFSRDERMQSGPRNEAMDFEHGDITKQIIGAAFEVHRVLGHGFLERVYQRAMRVELAARGLDAELEPRVEVFYKRVLVGACQPDILVNSCVVDEPKVAREYQTADEAQLINELKATGIKVGLLVNFGRDAVQFKRLVYRMRAFPIRQPD
jgi:GxxExxY protein